MTETELLKSDFGILSFLIVAIWSVAAFGAAYVLGHSVATKRLREWIWAEDGSKWILAACLIPLRRFFVSLLECPACLGFWLGLGMGFVIAEEIPLIPDPWIIVIAAFYTSGSNYILAKLTKLI